MTNEEFIESIRLQGEEWKDVVGFEGFYMVSNFGRLLSFHLSFPHLLTPNLDRFGYLRVCLSNGGKQKTPRVHRLVGEAFLPNPNNYKEIDHIDTDKTNNAVTNLRWCTSKDNSNNPLSIEHYRNSHLGLRNNGRLRPVVAIKSDHSVKFYETIQDVEIDGYSKQTAKRSCIGLPTRLKDVRFMYLSDYEKSLVNQ